MSLRSRRRAAALALLLGLAGLPAVSSIAAAATAESCADGVTVVVDLTDVGGEVEVGCAEGDPATGREALESAGFTPTDSIPGMICAIDSRPDPCPEEFDGSFWSYWTTDGEDWVAHTAGADGTDPAPGDVEGWRYNDGTTGPGLAPAEAAAALQDDTTGAQDDAETDTTSDASDGPGATTLWLVLGAMAVAGAVGAVVVRNRRR